MPGKLTTEERFWSKVDRSSGPDACWPWLGYCDANGYGREQSAEWPSTLAHRIAVLTSGRDPNGALVRHSCDNPPCCNPAHLHLGGMQENQLDKAVRGRGPRGSLPFGVSVSVKKGHRQALPRYKADVSRRRKKYYLGTYPTIQQAHFAAMEFRIREDMEQLREEV